MNSNLKLLPAALLVAMLALAGCGGGDDTPDPEPPTTTPEPQPPASVEQLSLDIQAAENNAMAANDMAAAALKSAMKYDDMLTTSEVAGNSGAAMMAAEAILKAEMDVGTALANAEAALAAASAAKTKVMALADDHPSKATLMTSVDRAVKNAEKYVAAIKAISTGVDLEAAVALVEDTDGKGTPRKVANKVGEAVATALAQATSGTTRTHGATAPPATIVAAHKVVMDDSLGMNWEEIVMAGGGTVTSMPIGTSPANSGVKVASVAGMAVDRVWLAATDGTPNANTPSGTIADGSTHGTANYMGIPGVVRCLGTCTIAGGNLEGSWYFHPDNANTHWVRNTENATRVRSPYVADSLYATYGHWLSTADNGATWTVTTFANHADSTTAGAQGSDASTVTANDDLGNKATYSGSAAGLSSRTAGSGDSKTTDSGRFTAAVTLNATFGAPATVTGVIKNFEGGAVNPAWQVNLGSMTIGDTTPGVAVTNGLNGTWTSTAYGTDSAKRPTGIFGGFSAHFADGDAAGAYATRKD